MSPVGYEPTTSAGERLQTHGLDHSATETGTCLPLTNPFSFQMLIGKNILMYNHALYQDLLTISCTLHCV